VVEDVVEKGAVEEVMVEVEDGAEMMSGMDMVEEDMV
jgi:hypothetical protein